MSKRTEINRRRRWARTLGVNVQSRARVEREMADMARMHDAGARLLWPVMAMMFSGATATTTIVRTPEAGVE